MSDAALRPFVARLRELKALAEHAAKESAPLVESAVRETAAAGTDPDGKPWPPKRDGSRALPNAPRAISAVAKGAAIVVTLLGVYVFHHYSKGKDRRRILPDGGAGIPSPIADVLRKAARRAFDRTLKR